MAEIDCRIVAMFSLALSLLFLSCIIFVRHHNHHHVKPALHTSEALSAERGNPQLDCNNDASSFPEDDSLIVPSFNATPCESNETSDGRGFHIGDGCLQCICEASTECKPTKCAGGEMCGLFNISMPYWIDAGKPTVDDSGAPETDEASRKAYLLCVNNQFCAARAVKGYMSKFKRDCDGDGLIDCYDYAAIHIQGPGGCLKSELSSLAFLRLDRCLEQFEEE